MSRALNEVKEMHFKIAPQKSADKDKTPERHAADAPEARARVHKGFYLSVRSTKSD